MAFHMFVNATLGCSKAKYSFFAPKSDGDGAGITCTPTNSITIILYP